jgi:hypothetical protein
MKFRTIAVLVTAAGLSLGAAGLSLAGAGSAVAQPLGHPKKHKPVPPPQVVGSRLQTALLPGSAFGDGFTASDALNTGRRLWSTRASLHVPNMSCGAFEDYTYVGGFGNTAGATDFFTNPNPWPNLPNAVLYGIQNATQFASTQAAAMFFSQAYAKYLACNDFTEPNPGDTNPGGGTLEVTNMSVSKTTIGGNHAFAVTQASALSEAPGFSLYDNLLVVVSGTNVYQSWDLSGTNDQPSDTLMIKLIKQVQALYPHHK